MSIDAPGVYSITDEQYHADCCAVPSLSSSVAKVLIDQTPLHAWFAHPRLNPHFEAEENGTFDLGRAGHDLILRGESGVVVIDADDFRTKAAREARDAAYKAGKTPLIRAKWDRVKGMEEAVRRQLALHRQAADAFRGGKPEQTLIWREGAVWCRAKLDWLPASGNVFHDLKTTTDANPARWERRAFEIGADMQSGFYRRGIKAVLGIDDPVFRFVVVENDLPHALSVIELDPAALDLADRKAQAAIRLWGECVEADRWPAYPPVIHHIGPPAWELSRWEERAYRAAAMADLETEFFGA